VALLEGELPSFDLQTPLSSLAISFGDTLETIPASPAYLVAPEQDRQGWAERLGPAKGKRIGIAWSGNPENVNHLKRLLPLEDLLAALPSGVETVSLQVGADTDESAAQLAAAGVRRTDQELTDFADTAGLIANLDLVVTGDTSVAHLAGALGKPVWLLVSYVPDWRWLLTREDSPWYPSLRLLRQAKAGDWSAPMARLKADLKAWAT
jgi:ADP-heptose:LPS heptosyltransferase